MKKIRVLHLYVFSVFLLVCFYAMTGTVNAQNGTFSNAKFEGILTTLTGPSICSQGAFAVRDCSGNVLVRIEEVGSSVDPNSFLGQFVRIQGEDVGDECPVIRINTLRTKSNSCTAPQQPIGPKDGFVGQTAGGDFVLIDCAGNTLFQLLTSRSVDNFAPFVGIFVSLKGHVPVNSLNDIIPSLSVRTVVVKANGCPVVTPSAGR